jgi:hypothetical protein
MTDEKHSKEWRTSWKVSKRFVSNAILGPQGMRLRWGLAGFTPSKERLIEKLIFFKDDFLEECEMLKSFEKIWRQMVRTGETQKREWGVNLKASLRLDLAPF